MLGDKGHEILENMDNNVVITLMDKTSLRIDNGIRDLFDCRIGNRLYFNGQGGTHQTTKFNKPTNCYHVSLVKVFKHLLFHKQIPANKTWTECVVCTM